MLNGSALTRNSVFLICSLIVCAAAMIIAAWFYYNVQRRAVEHGIRNELAAIAAMKTAHLATWRRERIGDGAVLQGSPLMNTAARVLSGAQIADADRSEILAVLQSMTQAFDYSEATLVDRDGSVRIRLKTAAAPHDQLQQHTRRSIAGSAVTTQRAILIDLSLDTRFHQPLMALAVPVRKDGAFIFEIDPATFLYPYLASWPTLSGTAETVLARREGDSLLALNELRTRSGSALVARRPLSTFKLPGDAELRSGWFRHGTNYAGTPVFAMIRQVDDSPWLLSAQIDESEVEAPLHRLAWEMTLIVVLIAAANGAGVGAIWRNHQAQAYREREQWFRAIANDTPALLWMFTPDGRNTFINEPLARFVGSQSPERGWVWTDNLHPEDLESACSRLGAAVAAQSEFFIEVRLRRFDGSYRWVTCSGTPRFSRTRELLGYAASIVDITERRDAEQQLHALTARLINAQEEERTRIARELHDDISQQVATLSMALSLLKRRLKQQPEAIADADQIRQKLVELAESTRRISHELHPGVLQHSGLAAALRQYCEELSAMTSHRIVLQVSGECDVLPPPATLALFRIAQEGLQNSIKHSGANETGVSLARVDGSIRLSISDEGVGMDPESTGSGLGLVSIRERTRLAHGTLDIQSRRDHGVTIAVCIPVAEA